MTIGLAASQGGHLTVLLSVKDAYSGKDAFLITNRSSRMPPSFDGRTYAITEIGTNPLILLLSGARIFSILGRERPTVVVSTGAEIAVPFLIIGRILGARTIYIESLPRAKRLSMTGRILIGLVDVFVVQSRELEREYEGRVEYWGTLL